MPPPGDLQLVEARQAPERHRGARVRWGGTVVATRRDDAGNTRVEVVERRLDDRGRPRPGSASDGRFVILAAPEVDSSLYLRGNEITVAGILDGTVDGSIGEQPQHFPVVRVEDFVRWESRWPYHAYDPWYGPRVRFGVGIGHYRHHHGHYHGHPYWW